MFWATATGSCRGSVSGGGLTPNCPYEDMMRHVPSGFVEHIGMLSSGVCVDDAPAARASFKVEALPIFRPLLSSFGHGPTAAA